MSPVPTQVGAAATAHVLHDFRPLGATSRIARRVTDSDAAGDPGSGATTDRFRSNARIVGGLVHRLLERQPAFTNRLELVELADRLLRADERLQHGAPHAAIEKAADRYLALVSRPDVRSLFSNGRRWHEVPVTLGVGTVRTRGSIDTLILLDSGSGAPQAVVLEFKTGTPSAWHQTQLDQYVAAASALLPATAVKGLLIYSDAAVGPDFSRA